MDTAKYFDTKAADYDKKRSKGILGKWVSKEEKIIQQLLDVKKGETVLDVGCGQGRYSRKAKLKGGKPYGIDMSPGMIKEYNKNGFFGEVADIVKKSVNKKFDKIVCGGALEFTSNPDKALKNISKSLKKHSTFVLLYPRLTSLGLAYKLYHFKNRLNIYLFSDRKINNLFEKNGMKIVNLIKPHSFAGVLKAKLK
jgi:2-polyprenyl-3-methyl-5-hydroxy-6-metoxy-1,4-benzoquinol methylase